MTNAVANKAPLHRLVQQWRKTLPSHCVLLTPTDLPIEGLKVPVVNAEQHRAWLENAQRFRGAAYLKDGAIAEHQLVSGRWIAPEDETAWQLILCDPSGAVCGVIWYHPNPVGPIEGLHCYHPTTVDALEWARDGAKNHGLGFVEMGGWVASSSRTNFFLLLLIGVLHRWVKGGLAAVIITERRHANHLIKALGGGSVAPPYFDARFGCNMELLIVDSRDRSTAYEDEAGQVTDLLPQIPIIAREAV